MNPGTAAAETPGDQQTQHPAAPSISLPKGGRAIRGLGEKFAATLVIGTGSMSVSMATSHVRSGFGPQLPALRLRLRSLLVQLEPARAVDHAEDRERLDEAAHRGRESDMVGRE